MICGITAEYNPFHNGHAWQISELRRRGAGAVVAVMSGNYVQRGEPAIFDKWMRARAAVCCGADLVAELPVRFSAAPARDFALASVDMLRKCGADTLAFSCETPDVSRLAAALRYSASEEFSEKFSRTAASGSSYPRSVCEASELYTDIFTQPNNLLALEYMRAAGELGFGCGFIALGRLGARHDSQTTANGVASAAKIRELIRGGGDYSRYLPGPSRLLTEEYLSRGNAPAGMENLERAVIASLRMLSAGEIAACPGVSEGLENRIFSALRRSETLEELYSNVKCKRFTHSRIRRIVLNLFLRAHLFSGLKTSPYIRPLAFTAKGAELIAEAARRLEDTAVYTKSSSFSRDPRCSAFFEYCCRCDSVYPLFSDRAGGYTDEHRRTPFFSETAGGAPEPPESR